MKMIGTEDASSTMNTVGFSVVAIDGQFKTKRCTSVRVVFAPQPAAMNFNDGATDRQPHSQSVRLRRLKRFEQSTQLLIAQAGPAVYHADANRFTIERRRANGDDALGSLLPVQGLKCVQQDVEHDLLQLNLIATHWR